MELVMFSKMLKRTGGLSVAEAGERTAELGFDGVDLTVRPGGHVEPGAAEERLPEAVGTLRDLGLSVPMVTTAVTDTDGHAEALFGLADDLGIGHLKLGYWRYDGFGTLEAGLSTMRSDLAAIRDLAADHDVTPAVHTHSGAHLSANPAFLVDTLQAGDPEDLGIYVDPGHLAVEGGRSGWELNLDAVADHVAMVSIKDFAWERDESGWDQRKVPLGEGIVPWARVFDRLDAAGFDGPISVHSEYGDLDLDELLAQTAADVEYLRAHL